MEPIKYYEISTIDSHNISLRNDDEMEQWLINQLRNNIYPGRFYLSNKATNRIIKMLMQEGLSCPAFTLYKLTIGRDEHNNVITNNEVLIKAFEIMKNGCLTASEVINIYRSYDQNEYQLKFLIDEMTEPVFNKLIPFLDIHSQKTWKLQQHIKILEKRIKTLEYSPGGQMYQEALSDFKKLI